MKKYEENYPLVPPETNPAAVVQYNIQNEQHGKYDVINGIYKERLSPAPAARDSALRVVGPLRLTSILFFLAYGGSYGVEGMREERGERREERGEGRGERGEGRGERRQVSGDTGDRKKGRVRWERGEEEVRE